jgi:hypothetical protein
MTSMIGEATTADGVKVVTDETAEVPPATATDVTTESEVAGPDRTVDGDGGGDGATASAQTASAQTAPVADVPAPFSPVADHAPVPEGFGASALDAGQARMPWGAKVSRPQRRGLVVGLAAVVVVVCVVAGVLVATMSTSSNKGQQARQVSPPQTSAPAPPSSPLKLASSDQQGAVYNVNASRLVVSAVANGRVWLEVVAGTGPFGPALWQGILTEGQSQTITNNAPVWIRVGAASNVALTVNGSGVLLPPTPSTYNLTFSGPQA